MLLGVINYHVRTPTNKGKKMAKKRETVFLDEDTLAILQAEINLQERRGYEVGYSGVIMAMVKAFDKSTNGVNKK